MTALESPRYQIAREQIKGNPVITSMAADVATVALAELALEDGTPRFAGRSMIRDDINRRIGRLRVPPVRRELPPSAVRPGEAHRRADLLGEEPELPPPVPRGDAQRYLCGAVRE